MESESLLSTKEGKMARQSKPQKETVSRVMHEFKHGELRIRGEGPKVKNRKQAIAIALRESGSTNQESRQKNAENLRKTKAKERKGETAEAEKEGKKTQDQTMRRATARRGAAAKTARGRGGAKAEKSKSDLYAEARRRNIPGRSRMSKEELSRALG